MKAFYSSLPLEGLLGILCLFATSASAQSLAASDKKIFRTLSGYVREAKTGTVMTGVHVSVPSIGVGTTTNAAGFYSLAVPAKWSVRPLVRVSYSFVGYQTENMTADLNFNSDMNIELKPDLTNLKEVVVKSNAASRKASESVQMSSLSVPIQQVKEIPSLLGEKDVLKSLQLLPGVQKGSEGSTGLYVRGGGPDQNLVLLDDAPIYHTSHLFGFFSLFNGDAIKSVDLTKGGFPAHFGGRLSSVVEMQMKDGNRERLSGEGGIGLISSRLTLEGPIKRGKSSFLVSGRRTYADLVLKPFMPSISDHTGYFYDINLKATFDVTPDDFVSVSAYNGQDRFVYKTNGSVTSESGNLSWGNTAGTARWQHRFNNALTTTTSLFYSHYQSNVNMNRDVVSDDEVVTYTLRNRSGIRDAGLKSDFTWQAGQRHTLRWGLALTSHQFRPSSTTMLDGYAGKPSADSVKLNSWEGAVYLEDTWKPVAGLQINAGLRYSGLVSDGKTYSRPEPRVSVAYTLPRNWAVKASYASMSQYVHLLSNSGIGLPTDIWVPSTSRTAPQRSQQVAFGIAKDFASGTILTIEGFYKTMDNMVAYKEGASSLSIGNTQVAPNWEDQITYGKGKSYGAEFLLQKKVGRFTGWAGYTLSWTQQQFDELNFGKPFWARYDRRHDISLVGVFHLSDRITLSGTWVYGTGQALTLPQGQYWVQGSNGLKKLGDAKPYYTQRVFSEYGERNNFRQAPYHRLDLGIQFHKKMGRRERTWEISFYNAYNRQNPFFYYLDAVNVSTEPQVKKIENRLKQITLFPVLPSISYGYKF